MRLQKLRARLGEIHAKADAIVKAAEAAKRSLTDVENTDLKSLTDEFKSVEAEIASIESVENMGGIVNASQPRITGPSAPRPVQGEDPASGFRNISEFFRSVRNAAFGRVDPRLVQNAITTFGGEGGPGGDAGGFAVPPQFATAITQLVTGEESLVSRFTPIMTGSNQVILPTDETTPHGTAGIYAEWLGEGSAMTARAPSLKQATVQLYKVGAFVNLSDELAEDAPAIQSYITRKVSQALAGKVNEALVNGDGLAKPLGLLKAPALVTQAKSATGSTAIAAKDVANMASRMLPEAFRNSFWLCHSTVLPYLWTLTLGDRPMFVQDFQSSPYGTLFGRPIVVSEYCQDYNTAGDIMLVSSDGYAVAIKAGGVQTAASIHFAFDQGLQSFRAIMRVGGTPLAQAAMARKNGSNTLSHIIALAARS